MNKKIAEISIDLYQRGLLAKCEELEMEVMCSSGEELMDFLNDVQSLRKRRGCREGPQRKP